MKKTARLPSSEPAKLETLVRKATERFWSHVEKSNGCWTWTGGINFWGYGQMNWCGRNTGAYRVSWMIHNGPITGGLFVLHRCDNRKCVNPEHLWLGTQKDNIQDCIAKGRQFSLYRGVTHCKYGHEFTPENTGRSNSLGNGRYCRTCNKRRCLERHYRKKLELAA